MSQVAQAYDQDAIAFCHGVEAGKPLFYVDTRTTQIKPEVVGYLSMRAVNDYQHAPMAGAATVIPQSSRVNLGSRQDLFRDNNTAIVLKVGQVPQNAKPVSDKKIESIQALFVSNGDLAGPDVGAAAWKVTEQKLQNPAAQKARMQMAAG